MSDNLKEREAFEAWYAAYCMPGESDWFRRDPQWPDEYEMSHTSEAWEGWKTRAAIEADRAAVPAGWVAAQAGAYIAICEMLEATGFGLLSRNPNADQLAATVDTIRELLAAAHQPVAQPGEQAAFESWIGADSTLSIDRDGHGYVDMTTEMMWNAWSAAKKQPVAQPSEPVTWNSPEDTTNAQGLVWLREKGSVFLGYYFDQTFREYRDTDGHYVGQQDAESYWARHEDGEPCEPDGWCQLLPPLPTAQAKPEQASQPDPQLLKFYGVSTATELIAAQAAHIEKLQAKVSPPPVCAPQRVREG